MGSCPIRVQFIKRKPIRSFTPLDFCFLADLVALVGPKAAFASSGAMRNTGVVPVGPLSSVFFTTSEGPGEAPLSSELHSPCVKLPVELAFQSRAGQLELAGGQRVPRGMRTSRPWLSLQFPHLSENPRPLVLSSDSTLGVAGGFRLQFPICLESVCRVPILWSLLVQSFPLSQGPC